MLIVLSEALRDSHLQKPLSPKARDALINLSTATYDAKHLVTGSRRLFEDLQKLDLDREPTRRFKEASAYIADAQALRLKVPTYLHVQPIGHAAHVETTASQSGVNQVVFNVPLDYFADSGRAVCSFLIGENVHDTDIYALMGEAYATQLRGFRCVLAKADGHGEVTPQTFESFARQDFAVLCVVDSDRREPDANVGRTAADAIDLHEVLRAQGKVATVHVLPCRELENLLPAALVTEALPPGPRDPQRSKVLSQKHRLGKADFDDLKDLVKLDRVAEYLARCPSRERANLCFSGGAHEAVREVGALVWSFGLAARKGRL